MGAPEPIVIGAVIVQIAGVVYEAVSVVIHVVLEKPVGIKIDMGIVIGKPIDLDP